MADYTISYESKAEERLLALDDAMQRQIREHVEWYVASFICSSAKRKGFRRLAPVGSGPLWTTYSDPFRIVLYSDPDKKAVVVVSLEPYGNFGKSEPKLDTATGWRIEITPTAESHLAKLGDAARRRVMKGIDSTVLPAVSTSGIAGFGDVSSNTVHWWPFHVEGYRIGCWIDYAKLTIQVENIEISSNWMATAAAQATAENGRIQISPKAETVMNGLDKKSRRRIMQDLRNFADKSPQQRNDLAHWRGNQSGFWQFASGRYNLLCRIGDNAETVELMEIKSVAADSPASVEASGWQIKLDKNAGLDLGKLDGPTQKQIIDDLHGFVMPNIARHNVRKASTWNRSDLWPFRSGDYRILCRLLYETKIVEIMEIRKY